MYSGYLQLFCLPVFCITPPPQLKTRTSVISFFIVLLPSIFYVSSASCMPFANCIVRYTFVRRIKTARQSNKICSDSNELIGFNRFFIAVQQVIDALICQAIKQLLIRLMQMFPAVGMFYYPCVNIYTLFLQHQKRNLYHLQKFPLANFFHEENNFFS